MLSAIKNALREVWLTVADIYFWFLVGFNITVDLWVTHYDFDFVLYGTTLLCVICLNLSYFIRKEGNERIGS